MTGNLKLFINFVWKFMGTVRFGNDHVAAILGFGDLQWRNILITRVYFVEGLGHNLFSVGQFCDSNLEVAFRRDACFVRNLEGVDLLKEDRSKNLYTINLHEMASASPICLMARASSTKSWLWHQRLSHLNFDTINDLARNDLVACLLKFKYHKEHLCPSCEQGKSKRTSHPPKPVPNLRQRLHLLYMDLCGPMRIASINEKRYVLVIGDDYSRYTWVHFLRSKDEAPEVIIKFLNRITVLLQVVERRNRMLVEAARTMLIFSRAPLFLWAEAVATACFTQNRSIIHCRFKKTPYELINSRKLDISFLHVFSALCYPKNDREDIGKLGAKGDIGFFIGYSADSCTNRIYNHRTNKIIETMNVSFDEFSAMVFEQCSSKPRLNSMTSGHISSGLDLTYASSTITMQQPSKGELDLLFEAMYDDYIGGRPSATARTVPLVQEPQDSGFELTGFLDADYAGCKDTFKSTSSGAQFLGEKLVSWSSKKQDCTMLSTAEAEYVSLSACCAQVLWMRTQLTDYGFYFDKIPIYRDSKSAIAISCNPVQHSRTKHITVRYHFIKEHVEKGTIELYFVKTDYQLAEIFTKALPADRLNYLVHRLGIRSLSPKELKRL
nr:retrovirus-related Pol polyprotein from transposon TNT 1-94 [Tanacetum cinerariifolium]